MRSRLPCRGHCLHPGTPFLNYAYLSGGRGAAELLPRHTSGGRTPKAIQTSFRRLAIPQFASGGQGDLKPGRLASLQMCNQNVTTWPADGTAARTYLSSLSWLVLAGPVRRLSVRPNAVSESNRRE